MKGDAAEIGFERSNVEYWGLKINFYQRMLLELRGTREVWGKGRGGYVMEFSSVGGLASFCGEAGWFFGGENECLSTFYEFHVCVCGDDGDWFAPCLGGIGRFFTLIDTTGRLGRGIPHRLSQLTVVQR